MARAPTHLTIRYPRTCKVVSSCVNRALLVELATKAMLNPAHAPSIKRIHQGLPPLNQEHWKNSLDRVTSKIN